MRRLPIYFLIDTCLSMSVDGINQIIEFVDKGIKDLRNNPQAIETVYYTYCTYGNNKVLIDDGYQSIINYVSKPLICSGYSNINYGIEAVKEHYNEYFVESNCKVKGDWKPILMVFSLLAPSTKIDNKLLEFIKNKFQEVYILTSQNEYVLKNYQYYFSNVLTMDDSGQKIFSHLFSFSDEFIVTNSEKVNDDYNTLPPPPNECIFPI